LQDGAATAAAGEVADFDQHRAVSLADGGVERDLQRPVLVANPPCFGPCLSKAIGNQDGLHAPVGQTEQQVVRRPVSLAQHAGQRVEKLDFQRRVTGLGGGGSSERQRHDGLIGQRFGSIA